MPRTGKGGKVDGTVGQAYSNRTDLNAATTVPNQGYGMATQQREAMKAVPMAQAQPTPGPTQTPSPQAPATQPQQSAPAEPLLFDHPTERPGEPITHGLPVGPGGGPEVLNLGGRPNSFSETLTSLAQDPAASEELQRMAYITQQTGF